MAKIFKIYVSSNCIKCPHYSTVAEDFMRGSRKTRRRCLGSNGRAFSLDEGYAFFPEWCPLPDEDEVEDTTAADYEAAKSRRKRDPDSHCF